MRSGRSGGHGMFSMPWVRSGKNPRHTRRAVATSALRIARLAIHSEFGILNSEFANSTMSLANNIQAIQTILASVSGIENVYDTVRNWQTEKQFRDGAATPGGGIQFWFLTRESTAAEDLGPRFTARRHTIALHGYAAVHDAAASEKTFQGLIESVVEALDADRQLNVTARHSGPAQVRAVDFRIVSNVLCHHVEITLVVEDKPA